MPRIGRVVCSDAPYHVTQRGNYRQDIFEEEADREKYMEFFMMYKEKYNLKLYAWCLMSNHVHFVVEPSTEDGLAKVFNNTNMRYSQYFNRKRGLAGHLFQGRFFSCVLDEEHLYEAIRYVELNPLRANMVLNLEDYYWNSAYLRLTRNTAYKLDSIDNYFVITDWKTYLQEPLNEDKIAQLRTHTKTGRPLGNEKFIQKLEKKLGIKITIEKPGRKRK
jgi:putative transposase